jgi:serine/threonine-protein kinase HipA
MTPILNVYWDARVVGTLQRNEEGTMLFSYADAWLAEADAPPISQSLPKQPGLFSRAQSRPFFAGLLPDEGQREAVARAAGVSRQNDYALLDALGGDVAGALTILPQGQALPDISTEKPVAMTDAELERLLLKLPRRPFLVGDEGIRMSLAGAQPKIPVVLVDNEPALPPMGQPTTHIIKPANDRLEYMVENEAFSMRLAAACGLKTASVETRRAGATAYLLVERFDRAAADGHIRRVHQEDFCQALGIAPENKYAKEGGPNFADCFGLVRAACTAPAVNVLHLLDAAIFNVIIGNADAHGKNFSLLYSPHETVLTPLYDLIVTAFYPEVAVRFAMPIGRQNQFEKIDSKAWAKFAEDMGLGAPFVRNRVTKLAKFVLDKAPTVAAKLVEEKCDQKALDKIAALVLARARHVAAAM